MPCQQIRGRGLGICEMPVPFFTELYSLTLKPRRLCWSDLERGAYVHELSSSGGCLLQLVATEELWPSSHERFQNGCCGGAMRVARQSLGTRAQLLGRSFGHRRDGCGSRSDS